MDAVVTQTREQLIDAQLLLLERQLAAITAVVDLIESDFRALLAGEAGGGAEAA